MSTDPTSLSRLFLNPERAAPGGIPRISVAFIGDYGQGKSFCACSFPDPVVISWDPNRGTAEKMVGQERIIVPESYAQYQREILPAIVNRLFDEKSLGFPVQTIVEDTMSFKFQALAEETPVNPRNKFEKWQKIKTTARQDTRKLLAITRPLASDPTRPTYNLVGTWHLTKEYEENDDGPSKLIDVVPAFEGGFRDDLPKMFDCVFYCEATHALRKNEKGVVVTGPDGRAEREATYFVHTVNPDQFIRTKESIGGPPGKWNRLPARLDGTYQSLAKAWGFPL